MDELNRLAKSIFNIDYIFPYQRLVITNTLKSAGYYGESEKIESIDKQLVLLPTGAGKSLCFMYPGIVLKGVTLIIFPLLSLMADQERRINDTGEKALTLSGSTTRSEWNNARSKIEENRIKFILTNPETLIGPKAINLFKNIKFSQIVIDEAHTLSEWGESFRPAYLKIGAILEQLSCPTITAFTATASERIIKNINNYLFSNQKVNIVRGNPDRENIHYSTTYSLAKKESLLGILKNLNTPTIVFHSSRVSCEVTARYLSYRLQRRDILYYHAGLDKESKKEIEEWFFKSNSGILNATCAYGMGIDKSDIRTVIHYDSPLTVEAYLQESGRGGRDREKARAIVIRDFTDNIDNSVCRREELIKTLDFQIESCSGCDVCDGTASKIPVGLKQILIFIDKNSLRYRVNRSSEILNGIYIDSDVYYGFGILSSWDIDSIKDGIERLIKLNYIISSKSPLFKNLLRLSRSGKELLKSLH